MKRFVLFFCSTLFLLAFLISSASAAPVDINITGVFEYSYYSQSPDFIYIGDTWQLTLHMDNETSQMLNQDDYMERYVINDASLSITGNRNTGTPESPVMEEVSIYSSIYTTPSNYIFGTLRLKDEGSSRDSVEFRLQTTTLLDFWDPNYIMNPNWSIDEVYGRFYLPGDMFSGNTTALYDFLSETDVIDTIYPSASLFSLVLNEGPDAGGGVSTYEATTGAPVPEPATILLLGSGLVGLAGFGKKFKK